MPGTGGIGGWQSCKVNFDIWQNEGDRRQGNPPDETMEFVDRRAKGEGQAKVVVTFTFPNGDVRTEKLKQGEEVKISWD